MNIRQVVGIFLIVLSVFAGAALIILDVFANYNFNKNYESLWELADRSSTLQAKDEYITKFVDAINKDRSNFADYNAIFLKTPEKSFDNNLAAIITLRDRLKTIQSMDETSFEYQTAIQQITAQEQGEAQNMINDIYGCYKLRSYPILWGWIGMLVALIITMVAILGIVLLVWTDNYVSKGLY